jgi:hypothetical protein
VILSENEFLDRIKQIEVNEHLEILHPSCARKIIGQFYISGPNENQNQSKKIVEKLFRNCGEGNFEYIVSSFDELKIL